MITFYAIDPTTNAQTPIATFTLDGHGGVTTRYDKPAYAIVYPFQEVVVDGERFVPSDGERFLAALKRLRWNFARFAQRDDSMPKPREHST